MSDKWGRLFGIDDSQVQILQTVMNGDCLFDSIRVILAKETTLRFDCAYMRSVVARSLLDPQDKDAMRTLEHWHTLFHAFRQQNNTEHLAEYLFMSPSTAFLQWPLPASVVVSISNAMMNRDAYWGEEYALRVFEKQLQIRFVIFEVVPGQGIQVHHPLDHSEDKNGQAYTPTHYVFLHLQSKHYQPITFENRAIFRPQDLPVYLQRVMQASATNNGWVLKLK
jgi:hypothetical protein